MVYDAAKTALKRRRQRELVLWENSAVGAFAGSISAAATTPLDVIKTRLMTQIKAVDSPKRYTGWLDAFRCIVRDEGPLALFRGIHVRVAWISIGGALFFGAYEEARRFLALA